VKLRQNVHVLLRAVESGISLRFATERYGNGDEELVEVLFKSLGDFQNVKIKVVGALGADRILYLSVLFQKGSEPLSVSAFTQRLKLAFGGSARLKVLSDDIVSADDVVHLRVRRFL
jgi:hypothetical protein